MIFLRIRVSVDVYTCTCRGVSRIHERGPSVIILPSPPSRSPLLPPIPIPYSFSFPSLHSHTPSLRSRLPLIQLVGLGERCKLPQRVRAEAGRQTLFGTFWAENASDKSSFKYVFTKIQQQIRQVY